MWALHLDQFFFTMYATCNEKCIVTTADGCFSPLTILRKCNINQAICVKLNWSLSFQHLNAVVCTFSVHAS